jgi:hypothetical protein
VAMVQGMDCWNIDQFAVKNNRPDIIVSRLPDPDPELIAHYYSQYQKRLRKLGLTEDQLSSGYYVPTARIIATKQNDKFIEVKFSLADQKYNLKQYNIFVNDVPLFGAYGREISGNAQEITEKIELISGSNKIEISCMNEKGAESYRALTMAAYDKPVQGDLYYVGFGVSQYQDSKLNLQYADKDAKDLSKLYGKMNGQYNNVYIYTYTNEQCTVANIKQARDLLKNAKPDDTLVLFIAGHGVHDRDREATYYFVTYETDINNLSGTAANFEIIEDILQGIPPRNKLFLMDTCESGEIDDTVQAEYFAMADNRGIKSRALDQERSIKIVGKKETKRTYLYDKDRYIYNDLIRRSGAIVFSACKGGEFSYESDTVKNGFFTCQIINGLKGNAKTENGIVTIDSLKEFVMTEVPKLADGKQNPTVDRDNIYQKFGFPVVE